MNKFKIEISRKISDSSGACVQVARDKDGNVQLRRLDSTGRPLGHPITMPPEQARLVATSMAYCCNELYAEQAANDSGQANLIQLVISEKKAG